MARIWQEGFEDGLPNVDYLEQGSSNNYFSGTSLTSFPYNITLGDGRNIYSKKSLYLIYTQHFKKILDSQFSEVYARAYFYFTGSDASSSGGIFTLESSTGVILAQVTEVALVDKFSIKIRKAGTLTTVLASFDLLTLTWYKIEIYYKSNATTGGYEVKINDISIVRESNINTETLYVKNLYFGNPTNTTHMGFYVDDIAINDTSSGYNNSWCGNGTIVALKPKGAGTTTEWDTSQGYAVAEATTSTTNLKITAHGLATNDVIYNKTRGTYSIVTKVDADNLTTISIASQAVGDIIICYLYNATILAGTGTDITLTVLDGHNLVSYDVIVNTSRSNAIRRVICVTTGNVVYNYLATAYNGILGSLVGGQAATDIIKTFKVKQHAIANHWETVSKSDPNPQICNIQTTTSGDIDLFDMTELTADLGIPSTATIVAVSANIYAQEAGAGSQIKPVLRISGTNYEGSTISLSSGTFEYQTIYDVNPATSAAFTRAAIDAIEAGVKLV